MSASWRKGKHFRNWPGLPTWALQQVGSYLGYTDRDAEAAATVAPDPEPTWQERQGRRRALPIVPHADVAHDGVAADAVAGLTGDELIAALKQTIVNAPARSSGLSSVKAPGAVVAPGGAFTTGSRLIEKRQVGSIIGQARDQRDNTVQTAHRSGNAKSR
jgi:hypothetical protein